MYGFYYHFNNLRFRNQQARTKGVKVYGLAASGVGDSAEYLMRLVSAVTGARYTWLT